MLISSAVPLQRWESVQMLELYCLEQDDRVNLGEVIACTIKAYREIINMGKIYHVVKFYAKDGPGEHAVQYLLFPIYLFRAFLLSAYSSLLGLLYQKSQLVLTFLTDCFLFLLIMKILRQGEFTLS
jgi:hypothetical protein